MLRVAGLALVVIAAALWLGHKPLLKAVLDRVLARERLGISYQLEGNIFREFRVKNFVLYPIGPQDVERIEVDEAEAKISLRALREGGLPALIERLKAKGVRVTIRSLPESVKEAYRRKPRFRAINWNEIFLMPWLHPDELDVEGFRLAYTQTSGETLMVEDASVKAEKGVGEVRIGMFDVPKYRRWTNIRAGLDSRRGTVRLTGAQLDGDHAVEWAEICPDPRSIQIKGTYFGGDVYAALDVVGLVAYGRAIIAGMHPPGMDGAGIDAEADFTIGTHVFSGTAYARSEEITVATQLDREGDHAVTSRRTDAVLRFEKRMLPVAEDFYDGLTARLSGTVRALGWERWILDTVGVEAEMDGREVRVLWADGRRADGRLLASGSVALPLESGTRPQWFGFEFAADFPNGQAILAEPDLAAPNAAVTGTAGLFWREGERFAGFVRARADHASWSGVAGGQARVTGSWRGNVFSIDDAALSLGEQNRVALSGSWVGWDPLSFNGIASVAWADLSVLDPLMERFGGGRTLAGAVDAFWSSHGGAGNLSFEGKDLALEDSAKADASARLRLAEGLLSSETLRVRCGGYEAEAGLRWAKDRVQIKDIAVSSAGKRLVRGTVEIPLDAGATGVRIAKSGSLSVSLSADPWELEKLGELIGRTFPLKGRVSGQLGVRGTPEAPEATIAVQGANLIPSVGEGVAPFAFEGTAEVERWATSASATLRYPGSEQVLMTGTAWFDLAEALAQRVVPPDAPVRGSVRLAKTPLKAFLALAPTVRYVDGTVSADAGIAGRFAEPELSGRIDLDVPGIRFVDPYAPRINGIRGTATFSGRQLAVERLVWDLGGGSVSVGGKIEFLDLASPHLDLTLRAKEALVARNESVTARATADLKLAGPWGGAAATGEVQIVKGRFFREIEVLPIQLPGKPAPKPRASPLQFSIGFPPLAKAALDIAVKTGEPIAVQGNLARGRLTVDARLLGTGRYPTIKGYARLVDFAATLPFSKLDVPSGYVYFREDTPFLPRLDIQGTSVLRGYTVNVYLFGDLLQPKALFVSEPPLPQEEVLSLLGTGTTLADLTERSDALAGRAAVLAFQSLSRKIFKPGPMAEEDSLFDRFSLDLGGVDPRTGNQELTGRFRLTDRFDLIGNLDVQGNVKGQVKYLLRFK